MISRQITHRIAKRLSTHYSDFAHHNKKNPLDELIFILLSLTTTEPVYLRTYKALKKRFPRHSDLARASVRQIAHVIFEGGQYIQKAVAIRGIMHNLTRQFGRPTLASLQKMSDSDCEIFLTSLPGVGKKVARCVMMYSLGRKVFPIDTHCWRISKRLGWVPRNLVNKPPSKMVDALQAKIPSNLRHSLHVNMISLGRAHCKAVNPSCQLCPLGEICPKIGLKNK